MQITVLGGDGKHQAADENHNGVIHVAGARFLGAENAEQRKQHYWD